MVGSTTKRRCPYLQFLLIVITGRGEAGMNLFPASRAQGFKHHTPAFENDVSQHFSTVVVWDVSSGGIPRKL